MAKTYDRFIRPFTSDPYSAARETVMNIVLLGLILLGVASLATTLAGYIFAGYDFVITRLFSIVGVTATLVLFYYLARYRNRQRLVAVMLVVAIFICASFMANQWGLLLPVPLLLFSLAVVMAGILISSRFSLFAAALSILVLGILQFFHADGIVEPDLSWMHSTSTTGDVIGYGCLFLSIALITWLFNRQMEFSLYRAKKAEAALLRQNDRLEEKVVARTRELEKEQLEKMQQMYRFAELGHVSTALFHDLANHLSTVSLDIETLQKRTQPEILSRIDDNIGYIDAIVQGVRSQLQGKVKVEVFDIKAEIAEVAKVAKVSARAAQALGVDIILDYDQKHPLWFKGDALRFRQVIINLLSNAIEAHKGLRSSVKERAVKISVNIDRKTAVITVADKGTGIPANIRERIFDPFYTSKDKGTGIGLFIVRKVVERDFKGEINLVETTKTGTTFSLKLPMKRR